MSDIGSDVEAARQLVEEAEDRLFEKDPKHEYVAYMSFKNKQEREKEWQKLLRRFSRDPNAKGNVAGVKEVTHALVQYLIALEVALGERHPADACICSRVCDCQNPEGEAGVALVSHECPMHNENPKHHPECKAAKHWFEEV